MGSHVSYHSPTMAELSTPAPPKDGRMGISGAAQLPIMRQTRNILSVQTIQFWFRLEEEIPMVPYATSLSYITTTTTLTVLRRAGGTT